MGGASCSKRMIAIVDYGAGNLFSVKNALDFLMLPSVITGDAREVLAADSLILPGVGAFPDAMEMLEASGLKEAISEFALTLKKPLLGICLGMQMLFERSLEFKETNGLSFIDGEVVPIETPLKIPHMGYNRLEKNVSSPLLLGVEDLSCVYFVHSFMAKTKPQNVAAYCDYDVKIPALVQKENIFGAQFHPEKSGEIGLKILKNFGGL